VSARRATGVAVAAALAVAAAAIAVLAGTGSDGGGSPTAASSPAAATSDPVTLTIAFSRQPGAPRSVAHLRCRGSRATADGFLRAVGARRACAHARGVARLFTTGPDPHRACTEIFGGPERALVTGKIGDRRVRRSFKRTDGCQVADWQRAMPILPRPS
jgi:hypothetical protein